MSTQKTPIYDLFAILVAFAILLMGCADSKTICLASGTAEKVEQSCQTYEPYGLLDMEELKDSKVVYKVNVANVFWSIVLVETVIAPILIIGFDLWEPVRAK